MGAMVFKYDGVLRRMAYYIQKGYGVIEDAEEEDFEEFLSIAPDSQTKIIVGDTHGYALNIQAPQLKYNYATMECGEDELSIKFNTMEIRWDGGGANLCYYTTRDGTTSMTYRMSDSASGDKTMTRIDTNNDIYSLSAKIVNLEKQNINIYNEDLTNSTIIDVGSILNIKAHLLKYNFITMDCGEDEMIIEFAQMRINWDAVGYNFIINSVFDGASNVTCRISDEKSEGRSVTRINTASETLTLDANIINLDRQYLNISNDNSTKSTIIDVGSRTLVLKAKRVTIADYYSKTEVQTFFNQLCDLNGLQKIPFVIPDN
jgi:PBP1b-binding outer membrane lipoprotein LpoB